MQYARSCMPSRRQGNARAPVVAGPWHVPARHPPLRSPVMTGIRPPSRLASDIADRRRHHRFVQLVARRAFQPAVVRGAPPPPDESPWRSAAPRDRPVPHPAERPRPRQSSARTPSPHARARAGATCRAPSDRGHGTRRHRIRSQAGCRLRPRPPCRCDRRRYFSPAYGRPERQEQRKPPPRKMRSASKNSTAPSFRAKR